MLDHQINIVEEDRISHIAEDRILVIKKKNVFTYNVPRLSKKLRF